MAASSPSFWVSSISEVTPEDIFIRGYPMQSLLGRLGYPAISFLLIRGRIPTPGEARMMDVLLSSILDYALQKSGTMAARAIVSVNPQMTAGLSTAMLGAGAYAVSPEDAGRFITDGVARWRQSGLTMKEHAEALVAELRAAKRRVPGFGHQVFRGIDPRAEKLKNFARAEGVWGEANEWYDAVHQAFRAATGKHDLVMNDVGMLAGIMGQMGFTPAEMTGLALQSTFPGVIAHVSEELQSGAINRLVPDSIVEYDRTRRSLDDDMASAGWPA